MCPRKTSNSRREKRAKKRAKKIKKQKKKAQIKAEMIEMWQLTTYDTENPALENEEDGPEGEEEDDEQEKESETDSTTYYGTGSEGEAKRGPEEAVEEEEEDDEDDEETSKPTEGVSSPNARKRLKIEYTLSSMSPESSTSTTKNPPQTSDGRIRSKLGGLHHCWKCKRSANTTCLRKGHVLYCNIHDKFYPKMSQCRGCKMEAEEASRKQPAEGNEKDRRRN
jgi:hypothetical protein